MQEHNKAILFIAGILVIAAGTIMLLFNFNTSQREGRKAIELTKKSILLRGPEDVDTKILFLMKQKKGPLKINGWNAATMNSGRNYLVSFTFDEGFGEEGYFFDVMGNGIVRYVNTDTLLATSLGLVPSLNPSYHIEDTVNRVERGKQLEDMLARVEWLKSINSANTTWDDSLSMLQKEILRNHIQAEKGKREREQMPMRLQLK